MNCRLAIALLLMVKPGFSSLPTEILMDQPALNFIGQIKKDNSAIGENFFKCIDGMVKDFLKRNTEGIVHGGKAAVSIAKDTILTSQDWDIEFSPTNTTFGFFEPYPKKLLEFAASDDGIEKYCNAELKQVERANLKLAKDHNFGSNGMYYLSLNYFLKNGAPKEVTVDFADLLAEEQAGPKPVTIEGIRYQDLFKTLQELFEAVTTYSEKRIIRQARLSSIKEIINKGIDAIHPAYVEHYKANPNVQIKFWVKNEELKKLATDIAKVLNVQLRID